MTAYGAGDRRNLIGRIAVVAASALLLAGCATAPTTAPTTAQTGAQATAADAVEVPDAEAPDTSETSAGVDPDDGAAGSDAGGGCAGGTSAGYELFSDPAMSVHPDDGAIFGDGTPLSFAYDAHDESRAPSYSYDISYIQDDGSAVPLSGGIFFEQEGGVFSTTDSVFTSEADGRYGFFTVIMVQDVAFDGDSYDADTVELGRYCVLFATDD
ncbi:hypothetical protein [Compostimonas suwonensis]|uniref:Uncharacterized protein n=1 Tax=Compostimonas suwonensis TaxID=1048394 RepID=A0A2M9BVU3_9MICO|nr:hypothetical protein [Compostimonas suwonensis]PJJ62034.1 hypothetical protein CLV54_1826 [Compostimonas suwonensis]